MMNIDQITRDNNEYKFQIAKPNRKKPLMLPFSFLVNDSRLLSFNPIQEMKKQKKRKQRNLKQTTRTKILVQFTTTHPGPKNVANSYED